MRRPPNFSVLFFVILTFFPNYSLVDAAGERYFETSANQWWCPPGYYGWPYGENEPCTGCPVGKRRFYPGGEWSDDCGDCYGGQYQDSPGQTECSLCPAGFHTRCLYTGATNEGCKGQEACLACASGRYMDEIGKQIYHCKACDSGEVANGDQTGCISCSNGKYMKSGACHSCGIGKSAPDSSGSTIWPNDGPCVTCPSGKYQDLAGATEYNACKSCGEGKFASAANTYCANCPAGYSQSKAENDAWSCQECQAPEISSSEGESSCSSCSNGKYMNENAQTSCKTCAGDSFAVSASSTECSQCPEGYYKKTFIVGYAGTIAAACPGCLAGQYQDEQGQTECKQCVNGTVAAVSGLAACQECGLGEAADSNTQQCTGCADGTYQDLSLNTQYSCKTCPNGWVSNDDLTSSQIILREEGKACSSNENPADGYDAYTTGYDGSYGGVGTIWFGDDVGDDLDPYPTDEPHWRVDKTLQCALRCSNSDRTAFHLEPMWDKIWPGPSIIAWRCRCCTSGSMSSVANYKIYDINLKRTECVQCQPGTKEVGQTTCKTCAGGKIQPSAGQNACDQCDTGSIETNKLACVDCDPGTKEVDNTACVDCVAGKYQDLSKQTECKLCADGKYQDLQKQTECKTCGVGKYSPNSILPPTSACALCEPGKYQDLEINVDYSCKDCPENTSQPYIGSSACVDCATGELTKGEGATTCTCASGEEKVIGCSCDIPNCTAGEIWSNKVCAGDSDEFYIFRSEDTEHRCRSTVVGYEDLACGGLTKKECESIAPLDHRRMSIRCVWRPKAADKRESLFECAQKDCFGLIHREEIAQIPEKDFADLGTSDFYTKAFDGICLGDVEILMYDGDGDNVGTFEMQINRCATACLAEETTYLGFVVNPNGRCKCKKQNSSTCTQISDPSFQRYDFSTDVLELSQCPYVSPKFSNHKPCICGNEICDYNKGLRCDWSLLPKKQLQKVESVCSMRECVVGKRSRELCRCQHNTCPSGSRCTDIGECVYDRWDHVMNTSTYTSLKMVTETKVYPAKKTETVTYHSVTSGSCESHGYEYIWNTDNCKRAYAATEGQDYAYVNTNGVNSDAVHNSNTGPYGCFWDHFVGSTSVLYMRGVTNDYYGVDPCTTSAPCYCSNTATTIVKLDDMDSHLNDTVVTETIHVLRNKTIEGLGVSCSATHGVRTFVPVPQKPDMCGVVGGDSDCLVCDIPFGESGRGAYNCPCVIKSKDTCPINESFVERSRYDKCGKCGGPCVGKCDPKKKCKKESTEDMFSAFSKDKKVRATNNSTNTTKTAGCQGNCGTHLVSRYEEQIYTREMIRIVTNGIPNHEYLAGVKTPNPHKVCEHNMFVILPKYPEKVDEFVNTGNGIVGVLKTGAFLFNHMTKDGKVAVMTEKHSLDHCHGHASPRCEYHYHELSRRHACVFDKTWDDCEHIGYMLDGFKIYSHCRKDTKSHFLKSCYTLQEDQKGDLPGHYDFKSDSNCDLNEANGYNFTGKGIVDSNNETIEGWAYVASESFPYVMPKFMGIPKTFLPYTRKEILINKNAGCVPVQNAEWILKWSKPHICSEYPKAPGCDRDVCHSREKRLQAMDIEQKCATQRPCGEKIWIYPRGVPATRVSLCRPIASERIQCENGGAEPECLDKCGVPNGDGSSCVYHLSSGTVSCYGDLIPDACGVCGGKALDVCRDVTENQTVTMAETSRFDGRSFHKVVFTGTLPNDRFDVGTLKEIDLGGHMVEREDGTTYQSWRDCSADNPCTECNGYCGDDSHCEGDLQCGATIHYLNGITTGENYRKIPYGCMSSVEDAHSTTIWSVCFNSTKSSLKDIDRVLTPINNCGAESHWPLCKMCEGHCSTDADCEGTLECFDRTSKDLVPGCVMGGSGDVANMNYCWDSAKTNAFYNSALIDSTFVVDLTGASFNGAYLTNVNFNGVRIDGTDFRSAKVSAKDIFSAASFTNIWGSKDFEYDEDEAYDLKGQDITGLDFSLAKLQRAKLMGVTGKLKGCPLKENLPEAYYCHNGYISGFRAWHQHSELWPTFVKNQDIDVKSKRWLPTYNRTGVDTKELVLIGTVPREALFNQNVGRYDLSASTMGHRGTPSEFKSCEYAGLPPGYQCIKNKYVVGPGMDMSNVDITGMDFSNVDGDLIQWCMNDQKALNCPYNMYSMASTKSLHGVYCINGRMYGKGDIQGLDWAQHLTDSDIYSQKDRARMFNNNRIHWIFNLENWNLNVKLTAGEIQSLETNALHDVAYPEDCKYVLDIPYRVCVPDFMMHHLLYLDERGDDLQNALDRLKNGYIDVQTNSLETLLFPIGYRLKNAQFKDYADSRKPTYVASPGACRTHEGYGDIIRDECILMTSASGPIPTSGNGQPIGCYKNSNGYGYYEWSIPDDTSNFCEQGAYRCFCKKMKDWARSGVFLFGPGADVSPLSSLNYIDFAGVSLKNVTALGLTAEYSDFKNALSVAGFKNFSSLEGSEFEKSMNNIDLRGLKKYVVGTLINIEDPSVKCPVFGGSEGKCTLVNDTCIPLNENDAEALKNSCNQLSTDECESEEPYVFDRFLVSKIEPIALQDHSWDIGVETSECDADHKCYSVGTDICVKIQQHYRCDCSPGYIGRYCDEKIADLQNCWPREFIKGHDQICYAHARASQCNLDSRCIWAGRSPYVRNEPGIHADYKEVFCDNTMLIGDDMNYALKDLSAIRFHIVRDSTLDSSKGGLDEILSCPKTVPDMWICSPQDIQLHKHELRGIYKKTLGTSPLNKKMSSGERCCRDFNLDNLDLSTVSISQENRNFEGSTWVGAFGNARNFQGAKLGNHYRLVETMDEEEYAIVGPGVDLKNRDLYGANLHNVDLTGADLSGISSGWDNTRLTNGGLTDSGCTLRTPEGWSCLEHTTPQLTRYMLVGPDVDLTDAVIIGFNFSGIDLTSANLKGVQSSLNGCPDALPVNWGCTSQGVLLGPSANLDSFDLTTLETTPPWSGKVTVCPNSAPYACINGWFIGWSTHIDSFENIDVTGLRWNNTDLTHSKLKMIYGKALDCPILNEAYKCIHNRIVGPRQNLTGVDMTGWNLTGISLSNADLSESFGTLHRCPKKGFGYKCIENRLVGLGADITNMDFTGKNLTGVDMELYENLFDPAKNITLMGSGGTLKACYHNTKNRNGLMCIENKIVGPYQDVSGIDFTEYNGFWAFPKQGMYGVVEACPSTDERGSPVEYSSTFQTTCSLSKVFIGPFMDVVTPNYPEDIFSIDTWNANITDIDFSKYDLSNTVIQNVVGRLAGCPLKSPNNYVCVNNYLLPCAGRSGCGNILNSAIYPDSTKKYGSGWGMKKDQVPENIGLNGLLLANMILPEVDLSDTVWDNVRINHTILTLQDMKNVRGTTDMACDSDTHLPDNVRCVETSNMRKLIVRPMVNLGTNDLKNDIWSENFRGMVVDGGTWSNIRFAGVSLSGVNLHNVKFHNVWGRVTNHALKYSDDVVKVGTYVFSTGSVIGDAVDFSTAERVPNFPSVTFQGLVSNFDAAGVDLAGVKFHGDLHNITGSPSRCPAELPGGWACVGNPAVFLGPGQRVGPINVTEDHANTYINMTNVDISDWYFDVQYFYSQSYMVGLPWVGTGILGVPKNYPKNFKVLNGQWVGPKTKHSGVLNVDDLQGIYFYETDLSEADLVQTSDDVVEISGTSVSLPEGIVVFTTNMGTFLSGKGLVFNDAVYRIEQYIVDQSGDPNGHALSLSGLGGPLRSCNNTYFEYQCVGDWLLGPNVLWSGFNGTGLDLTSVRIHDDIHVADIPHTLLECPDTPPAGYICVNETSGYALLGPRVDVSKIKRDDLSCPLLQDGDICPLSFRLNGNLSVNVRGSHMDGTYWTGTGSVHFDFDASTTWLGTIFTDHIDVFKMENISCPFRFRPRHCDTSAITCDVRGLGANMIVYDGYVWPSDVPFIDGRLCIRNMNLASQSSMEVTLKNTDLAGSTLPNNASGIRFEYPPTGSMTYCPDYVPPGYDCKHFYQGGTSRNMLVHPKTSFANVDLSGLDLSGIVFDKKTLWSNVNGVLAACPTQTPDGWACINNILFGRNTNYAKYIELPDFQHISLDGLDLTGSVFNISHTLRNFRGNIAGCPKQLPAHYQCFVKDCSGSPCSFILGPYVSIGEVDMSGVIIGVHFPKNLEVHGVSGRAHRCPSLHSDMKNAGYACSLNTQNHLIGPSVDLQGIDFGRLTNDLSVISEGKVSLSFALYHGHYLIDDVGSDSLCETFQEHIIGGSCEQCR